MHVMAMKPGDPRRVVDLQKLDMTVPPNSTKTALDAWNGYHLAPLREEDRHLTTFPTPWGRYEYCNLPQGHITAGDAYTDRYDETTQGFKCMGRYADDTILWDDNLEENFKATESIAKKVTTTNLAINAINATPN